MDKTAMNVKDMNPMTTKIHLVKQMGWNGSKIITIHCRRFQ